MAFTPESILMLQFLFRRGPSWRWRIERKVDWIMSTLEEAKAALDSIGQKVSNVKGDTTSLLAKITELQSNPPSGMTPEQQALVDAIVVQAQSIDTALGEVDALVPDAAPPAGEPTGDQPA